MESVIARIRPIVETSAEYLLGLEVADEPGVLHAVTGVFANHGVSIRAAEQDMSTTELVRQLIRQYLADQRIRQGV